MYMWMVVQVLSPGVQDRQKTDLCSEVLRIPSDGREGLRHRP